MHRKNIIRMVVCSIWVACLYVVSCLFSYRRGRREEAQRYIKSILDNDYIVTYRKDSK